MTRRSLRSRIEAAAEQAAVLGARQYPTLVFLGDDGTILDDGSEMIRPWIGLRLDELPDEPARPGLLALGGIPDPLKVWLGVDPLEVLPRTEEQEHP